MRIINLNFWLYLFPLVDYILERGQQMLTFFKSQVDLVYIAIQFSFSNVLLLNGMPEMVIQQCQNKYSEQKSAFHWVLT